MEKGELLRNIENYFANTPKEHLQKVYDELKEYNQYGPTVEEYIDGVSSTKDKLKNIEKLARSSQDITMCHLA